MVFAKRDVLVGCSKWLAGSLYVESVCPEPPGQVVEVVRGGFLSEDICSSGREDKSR